MLKKTSPMTIVNEVGVREGIWRREAPDVDDDDEF